jgi:hypothetical protein
MDRFVLAVAAIGTAVLIGFGALWALRDYASPSFLNGARTAGLIDADVGDLIAARFPAAAVGAAHCPPLLDLTGHRTGECTLPVSGGELHLVIDSDVLRGAATELATSDALFVAPDAERALAAGLAQRFGERFDVRCPGPDVRVVSEATPVICSVEAPDVARRGVEVIAHGYAGAVYVQGLNGITTREERTFGRDVAERTQGGVVIAEASLERYLRESASGSERGEVGRRGLVGRARCPARIVLHEGSHVTCTVRVGGLPLRYDVHFEKGLGLRVDTDRRAMAVAALREVAVRFFERSRYTGGKPAIAHVDCGTAAVVLVEPGSSVPCTAKVGAETYEFVFQIDDANGAFRILGSPDD